MIVALISIFDVNFSSIFRSFIPHNIFIGDNMKIKFSIMFLVLLFATGCDQKSKELEKQNNDLRGQNTQLQQDLSARDEYIEAVTHSINDVYSNLETVREKEKLLLKETNEMEMKKKPTSQEIRQKLLEQIAQIDSNLQNNRHTIADLQKKVSTFRAQYVGLKQMVANLQHTIEAREQTIAELEKEITGLESNLAQKTRIVGQRDSLIEQQSQRLEEQRKQITTGYYVIGTRRELEEKRIIKNEGGFLWGWLGSTTVLVSGISDSYFHSLNKLEDTTLQINGNIDEIIPKRKEQFYQAAHASDHQIKLSIIDPKNFWQDNHLVIITD